MEGGEKAEEALVATIDWRGIVLRKIASLQKELRGSDTHATRESLFCPLPLTPRRKKPLIGQAATPPREVYGI